MAMTTAVPGTSTPVIQTRFLGSGTQTLRPQSSRTPASHQHSTITSKLNLVQIQKSQLELGTNVLAGSLFASLATLESASAAQQVLQELAAADASDSRGLALLVPLVPAIGWVLFNIFQPTLNQFNRMKNAKGLAIGFGLGALATVGFSSSSQAAAMQELVKLAEAGGDSDSRGFLILGLIVAAVGWVLYNIFQPALNQFNRMKSSKGVIGAIGIGAAGAAGAAGAGFASLQTADAAGLQEVASIAEGDNRGLLLLLLILPALGWVVFNILQPALNQINRMQSSPKSGKRK